MRASAMRHFPICEYICNEYILKYVMVQNTSHPVGCVPSIGNIVVVFGLSATMSMIYPSMHTVE